MISAAILPIHPISIRICICIHHTSTEQDDDDGDKKERQLWIMDLGRLMRFGRNAERHAASSSSGSTGVASHRTISSSLSLAGGAKRRKRRIPLVLVLVVAAFALLAIQQFAFDDGGIVMVDLRQIAEATAPTAKKKRKHPGFHTKFTWVDVLNRVPKEMYQPLQEVDAHKCEACHDASVRYREWSKLVHPLPVCRLFKTLCSRAISQKAYGPLVASAKMYNSVHAVWISLIVVLCTIIGIVVSSRQPGADLGAMGNCSNSTNMAAALALTLTPSQRQHPTNMPLPRTTQRNTSAQRVMHSLQSWWLQGATFTHPTRTFKLFIMILMVSELLCCNAPNISSYSTPELIAISQRLPPVDRFVPSVSHWLMPDLNVVTTDKWVRRLEWARAVHLIAWCAFLLLPTRRSYLATVFYTIGAVLYCVLGAIAVTYEHLHTMSGCMLYVLVACLAIPDLETNRRSAAWLRHILFAAILVPSYLFAGISKIRYDGIWVQLTGSWFPTGVDPAHAMLPAALQLIKDYPMMQTLMSWGNLVVEFFLPLAVLLHADVMPLRYLFHLSELLFHVSILILMSPNFLRHCLLHILAMDPLGIYDATMMQQRRRPHNKDAAPPSTRETAASRLDWIRICIGMIVLAWNFQVQLASDTRSLRGKPGRGNPYLPVPEYSMFVKSRDQQGTWYQGLVLDILALGLYMRCMFMGG